MGHGMRIMDGVAADSRGRRGAVGDPSGGVGVVGEEPGVVGGRGHRCGRGSRKDGAVPRAGGPVVGRVG